MLKIQNSESSTYIPIFMDISYLVIILTSIIYRFHKVSSFTKFVSVPTRQYFTIRMTSFAKNIDGTATAAQIRIELKESIAKLQETLSVTPGLAVLLVGERRDSAAYVKSKKKACAEIGMNSFGFDFPADVSQDEILAKIQELNQDKNVHGILVQLPLPSHINEATILQSILPEKDVDGLHPLNVAQLANTKTHSGGSQNWSFDNIGFHVSCTPQVNIYDPR